MMSLIYIYFDKTRNIVNKLSKVNIWCVQYIFMTVAVAEAAAAEDKAERLCDAEVVSPEVCRADPPSLSVRRQRLPSL